MGIIRQPVPPPSNEVKPPAQPDKSVSLAQKLADLFIEKCLSFEGKTETMGKNRAPWIDADNRRAGSFIGAPYCIASATSRLDDACKDLGLKNPVGVRPGTQSFWSAVPDKYKSLVGKKGMIAIFRARADRDRGHAAPVREDQIYGSNFFKTIEFNTDGEGSRDGDGCWKRTRSVKGDERLEWLGFADVCAWIMSANVAAHVEHNDQLPWDGKRKEAGEWTSYLTDEVLKSQLPDLLPEDMKHINTEYLKTDRIHRAKFWVHAISKMAEYESGFNPAAKYVEAFNDSKGANVVSRGLLQISFESGKAYLATLRSAEELHDPRINLLCAIKILERWVKKDGVFASGSGSSSRGGARYWSVLRQSSSKSEKILAHLKNLKLS